MSNCYHFPSWKSWHFPLFLLSNLGVYDHHLPLFPTRWSFHHEWSIRRNHKHSNPTKNRLSRYAPAKNYSTVQKIRRKVGQLQKLRLWLCYCILFCNSQLHVFFATSVLTVENFFKEYLVSLAELVTSRRGCYLIAVNKIIQDTKTIVSINCFR